MSGVYSVWGAGAAASAATITGSFNDATITQHLRALALASSQNFEAARIEVGEFMLGEVQDNLHDQKLFDGSPMPQSKAAISRTGKTLIDHHHLYDSYVYQLSDDGVEVGSALVYSAIHHFGGMTGRGHKTEIVARPVLGMTAQGERRIADIVLDWLGQVP